MKAMILAAGLGTRLKPLTDFKPKALVEVEGEPMLERVIKNLKRQGFDKIVVNVHHFSSLIMNFLKDHDFGVEIEISDESRELLDTGGGIVKGRPLLFHDGSKSVLVHNVDILSNADLKALTDAHVKSGAGATLLVSDRDSSRKLVFDEDKNLKGWHDITGKRFRPERFEKGESDHEMAFSGIYVLGKECVDEMAKLQGEGKFSVMDYFLDERRQMEVKVFEQKGLELLDIGKPATLSQASRLLKVIDCLY